MFLFHTQYVHLQQVYERGLIITKLMTVFNTNGHLLM